MMRNYHTTVKQLLAGGHTGVASVWFSSGVAGLLVGLRPRETPRVGVRRQIPLPTLGGSVVLPRPSGVTLPYAVDHSMISRLR
jgi:hypothetical protein